MVTVAALYVDPNGVYANLPDVDVWGEERDARLYDGPWPVVAHPPCARWSLMGLCRGYYDGNDDGCFEAALRDVRRFGGVLEHPAHSLAWRRFCLPRPSAHGWQFAFLDEGVTTEVDQGRYGFPARKPTWLYYVGDNPPRLNWGVAEKTAKGVGRMRGWGQEHKRSETPPKFRDVLLTMAREA